MTSRNTFLIGGVVVGCVVLCLCSLAVVGLAGAVLYYAQQDATAVTATPASPQDVAAQMDAIQQTVIELRGLQPTGSVPREFMSEAELRQRTLDDFNNETTPEEWADDTRALIAFGMIDPNLDLYTLFLSLYSEGVAGFYDPDEQELFVISEAGGLNAYEKTVFAHEYNHALQDQNYHMRTMGFSEEGWDTDSERAAAIQALLEGDATVLEEQYLDTFTRAERREYDAVIADIDVSIYDDLPDFILQDFAFPYVQGADFVRRYYDDGGWARVDEVWRNPPVSTEHILHPERYEAGDLPILVDRPALTDTLGTGWRQIDAGVTGEWFTFLMLAYGEDRDARLSERTAYKAAEGWGGDSYAVFYNETTDQTVVAQHWVWDTSAEATEFAKAFRDYGDGRFGNATTTGAVTCWQNGQHCLYANSLHTLWIMAPTADFQNALIALYPELQ